MPKRRTLKPAPDRDVRNRPHRPWTIMIYMAGDNNLSGDMASALGALEQNVTTGDGRASNVNVLAYFDSASLTAPTQYIDYTHRKKPHTHNVTPYDLRPIQGSHGRNGDPEDSASARSIISFVRWAIEDRNATADNYVLIFSGHSFGFYGTSFLTDQSSGRFISLRRFRWAIEEARSRYLYPRNPNKKIPVVGFDSCEMGMLEVAYELKNVASTVVASAGNVPNSGWGYAPMLRNFVEKGFEGTLPIGIRPDHFTEVGIKAAARRFVTEYVCQQQKFAVGGNSIDMAALDLDLIDPLAESVGELGRTLSDMLGLKHLLKDGKITERGAIVHKRTKDLLSRSRMSCQTYMHEQSVDIKDFCQRLMFGCREILHEGESLGFKLSEFARLQRLCERIIKATDKCVLQSGFSGDEYQFSKGISLYFPWTALTYLYTWGVYGNLRFSCGDYKAVKVKKGNRTTSYNRKQKPGPGETWDDFLLFYLYVVTLRQCESVNAFEEAFARLDSGSIADGEWQQTRRNWRETRTRARSSKPRGRVRASWPKTTRENWRTGTRENWPLTGTRENPRITGSKENPVLTGTRGQWSRTSGRENPRVTGSKESNGNGGGRYNPRVTGDRGVYSADAYLSFFSRIRNFGLDWQAKGLWPEADCAAHENGQDPKDDRK